MKEISDKKESGLKKSMKKNHKRWKKSGCEKKSGGYKNLGYKNLIKK